MTLRDPVYDAAANTLTYNVTFVPERHVGSIANFYRRHKSIPNFAKVGYDHSDLSVLYTSFPMQRQSVSMRSKPRLNMQGAFLCLTCCREGSGNRDSMCEHSGLPDTILGERKLMQ